MKKQIIRVLALCASLWATAANSAPIAVHIDPDETAFVAATGAVSLTGAIPNIGNQGTSVTLQDATLSAGNSIFVGAGWSSLLPNGHAIAISGPENVDITIDTGLATSFGFFFHEPTVDDDKLDGCNFACVDSTFLIEFLMGAAVVDSVIFNPTDDVAEFIGLTFADAFDSVRFTETVGGIDNEFFGEMFVARGALAVPEPAALLLFGSGLALLGFRCRRRKA